MKEADIIIMSQSCDLSLCNTTPLELVVACPVYPLYDSQEENPELENYSTIENILTERVPALHLLDKCPLDCMKNDYLIVDFRQIYSIPFNLVNDVIKKPKPDGA